MQISKCEEINIFGDPSIDFYYYHDTSRYTNKNIKSMIVIRYLETTKFLSLIPFTSITTAFLCDDI